jgi:hypothetical protein
MRRIAFTVAATMLVAAAVPASALAHHHHARHHARSHHAKIRRFGDQTTAPTSTNSADNAGTVQSFSGGVLTIALNDGSTVKGMVTNDTELECTAPMQSSTTTHEDGDGGGDQSSGDDTHGSGGSDQGDNDQNEAQGEDNNPGDDEQGEDQNEDEATNCSTSSLTPGAVVHEATLRIGGSGAVWQKVELVS